MTDKKKPMMVDEDEKIIQIEIERLTTFKDHPFKVQEDSDMKMLIESIEKYGILNPLIVRPLKEGVYEIVSGHRRRYAAEKLGYRKVPVIIRVMRDDESVIAMVDANLQRERISFSEKAFAFVFEYAGDDVKVVTMEFVFENYPTTVEITKTDLTGGKEIPGCELKLLDEEGNVVEEWTSTEEPHVIKELVVGKKYTLVETKPADGYVTAESIEFVVENTAEVQKHQMMDDVTKVQISKQDIAGKELPGAKLTILDENGNVVESWTSTNEPHYIEMLPIGKYILHEEVAPDGYLVANDVDFEVKDTGEVQHVVMVDEAEPTVPSETPKTGDEEMVGIVSSLIEKLQHIEDKYFYALEFDDYLQEMGEDGYVANQYAIYRVDINKKGSQIRHMPYQEVRAKKLPIRVDSYKQIHLDKMEPSDTVMSIFNRTRVFTEVSDVLVVYKEGELSCYYVDEERPCRITGFIQLNPTGAVISMDTKDYEVVGKSGKWRAADILIIDGKQYYLLEHQEYGARVPTVILDSYGKMVAESDKGFSEEVKKKILQQDTQIQKNQVIKQKQDLVKSQERMKLYFMQKNNLEHERNSEAGTEANYNMIDGCVNNLKEDEVSSASHRGQEEKQPKKKTSVLKKLREKQVAIAKKSGRPVPKYLEQQMGQERTRK